jgi:hypothetical protein
MASTMVFDLVQHRSELLEYTHQRSLSGMFLDVSTISFCTDTRQDEAYWRDHLQKTAKPDLDPVLTPARLDAVFNTGYPIGSPSISSCAHVTPQTTPGARMPPPVRETPPSTSSHTPRAATDDYIVERSAQSTTNSLRDVASKQPHPEPCRTSKWLRQNLTRDPKGRRHHHLLKRHHPQLLLTLLEPQPMIISSGVALRARPIHCEMLF